MTARRRLRDISSTMPGPIAAVHVWRDTDKALYTDGQIVGLHAATGAALPCDGPRVAIPFKRVKTILLHLPAESRHPAF